MIQKCATNCEQNGNNKINKSSGKSILITSIAVSKTRPQQEEEEEAEKCVKTLFDSYN